MNAIMRIFWLVLMEGAAATEAAQPPAEPPAITIRNLAPPPPAPAPVLHPDVVLLDAEGRVAPLQGTPLSLRKSCGACHDTAFIESHNYHAQVGLDEQTAPGRAASGRPWDTGPGMFGRFDPFLGRVLTPPGEQPLDLGTADWIRLYAPRHVGGGPAERSRHHGRTLGDAPAGTDDPDARALDEASGSPMVWDWKKSGTVELNCLLCHMRSPDNQERIRAIRRGDFAWASTATLAGAGWVTGQESGYRWNIERTGPGGVVSARALGLGHAHSDNCRQCHGRACRCSDPVVFQSGRDNWLAEAGGSVFSPGRMSQSGMNLAGKESLDDPWDVHAERLLSCSQCHHAPNNPAYDRGGLDRPEVRHLSFDARRALESEYLFRPDHNLAKGDTAQGTVGHRFAGTMRDCRDCHRAEETHEFLPFARAHFAAMECTACHVPRLFPATRRVTDWTLPGQGRVPRVEHAGVEGPVNDPLSLLTGQVPALLPRRGANGAIRLEPQLLHTAWYWVAGDPARPVPLRDLERALFDGAGYRADIAASLDRDRDGTVSEDERVLATGEQAGAVARRLGELGYRDPRIVGEIQPFTVSHGVGHPDRAQRDCAACHGPAGRMCQPLELAEAVPAGVRPEMLADSGVLPPGPVEIDPDRSLRLRPQRCPAGFYVMGAQRFHPLDWLGLLVLLGTLAGVALHGGLRLWLAVRRKRTGGAA